MHAKKLRRKKLHHNMPDYLPTYNEIALVCARIRKTWDATTEKSRRVHQIIWHSLEAEYFSLYFCECRRPPAKKKLEDSRLCDSEYWQFAIGDQWE